MKGNLLVATGSEPKFLIKISDFGLSRNIEGSDFYKVKKSEMPIKWVRGTNNKEISQSDIVVGLDITKSSPKNH